MVPFPWNKTWLLVSQHSMNLGIGCVSEFLKSPTPPPSSRHRENKIQVDIQIYTTVRDSGAPGLLMAWLCHGYTYYLGLITTLLRALYRSPPKFPLVSKRVLWVGALYSCLQKMAEPCSELHKVSPLWFTYRELPKAPKNIPMFTNTLSTTGSAQA